MSQEAPKTSWTYHPLDGQELLKWVFADAWAKLSQDGQFGANLSYHNPSYALKLEIIASDGGKGPTNGATVVSNGDLKTYEAMEQKFKDAMKEINLAASVGSDGSLREPDRARELLDEGRYKIANEDGQLVDKKVRKGEKGGK